MWTPEMRERLKALAADGCSSGTIAEKLSQEFGMEFTRNAVSGKIHRMKLQVGRFGRGGMATTTKIKVKFKRRKTVAVKQMEGEATIFTMPFYGHCKFEISGSSNPADYRFCCKPTEHGRTFCPDHWRIVYVPSVMRLPKTAIY